VFVFRGYLSRVNLWRLIKQSKSVWAMKETVGWQIAKIEQTGTRRTDDIWRHKPTPSSAIHLPLRTTRIYLLSVKRVSCPNSVFMTKVGSWNLWKGECWGIRWKRSGLVHCAGSDTVWSKRLIHCQVLWAGKDVEERISTQQACSVLFDFLSSQHNYRTGCKTSQFL